MASPFPRYRLRLYTPKTRKVTLVATLPNLASVKRVLTAQERYRGKVSPIVESSKKPRIYVQKIKGRRADGSLITEHVSITGI